MEINQEQMPPKPDMPPVDKGIPSAEKPDTGSKPDMKYPARDEGDQSVDPIPDMDHEGMDPDENETIN